MNTYHSGSLCVLRASRDTFSRKPNGELIEPPRVFVLRFSPKLDRLEAFEIAWEVAEELAPNDIQTIVKAMGADRDRESRDWAAKYKPRNQFYVNGSETGAFVS